jgi:hypothetical protein
MTLRAGVNVLASVACLALAGCGGSAPPPPNSSESITGAERFGWDQPAADAAELATFKYALYVDDVRSEAADVSCTPGASAGRFACTARLPPMSAGVHNIQVASFVVDGGAVQESARSPVVRVTKQ